MSNSSGLNLKLIEDDERKMGDEGKTITKRHLTIMILLARLRFVIVETHGNNGCLPQQPLHLN